MGNRNKHETAGCAHICHTNVNSKNIIFLVKRWKMTHNLGVVETYNEKYDIWATGTSKRPHDGHTSVTNVDSKKGTDVFSANKCQ